jgi:hypothetical protein
MDTNEAVQKLQQFIIEHDLPDTEMALYGLKCPYCGKSDRIRKLEDPDDLSSTMKPEDRKEYAQYWERLAPSGGSLGVCKFCQNPLRISVKEGKAEAVYG